MPHQLPSEPRRQRADHGTAFVARTSNTVRRKIGAWARTGDGERETERDTRPHRKRDDHYLEEQMRPNTLETRYLQNNMFSLGFSRVLVCMCVRLSDGTRKRLMFENVVAHRGLHNILRTPRNLSTSRNTSARKKELGTRSAYR